MISIPLLELMGWLIGLRLSRQICLVMNVLKMQVRANRLEQCISRSEESADESQSRRTLMANEVALVWRLEPIRGCAYCKIHLEGNRKYSKKCVQNRLLDKYWSKTLCSLWNERTNKQIMFHYLVSPIICGG